MNSLVRFFSIACLVVVSLSFITWRKWNIQQRKDILVVGIVCAGYPYAAINKQGNLDGFDIDLAYKVAKKLGKRIVFKDMPMEILRSALKMSDVDFIGSSLVITPKNLQRMDMIDVYGKPKAEMTCVFWEHIPEHIHTIHDLKKSSLTKPLAAMAEAVWVDVLMEHGITNIMELEQYRELILPLKYGQVSAIAVGPRHALTLQKQYPEIKILKVALDKPWGEGVGIGLKKGRLELYKKLADAIDELKKSGEIKALIAKWFGEAANGC